jgi:hypothetical protein
MHPSLDSPTSRQHGWTYASLTVLDGPRQLKPAQVGYDRLIFREPPRIKSTQVEIVLTNGDDVQRQLAFVLPHDPTATQIPIRLLP